MARKLIVEVILDSAAYAKQVKKAQAETTALAGNLQKTGRSAETATVGVKGLGKAALTASAYFVGFQTAAEAIRSTFEAGREAAVVQKQLQQQLRTSGISWDDNKSRIEDATAALSRLSAFTTDDLLQSFTQLVRTTGDVNQALNLNKIAADVARGRHISLLTASNALGKAYNGQTSALRRLGISLPSTAKGMDAIRIVAQRYAGQAKAGADATDHLRTSIHEAQVQIGQGLTPVVAGLAEAFNKAADAYIAFRHAAADLPGGKQGFFAKLISGTLLEQIGSFTGTVHKLGVELGFVGDQAKYAGTATSGVPAQDWLAGQPGYPQPPGPNTTAAGRSFYPGGAPSAKFGHPPKGATVEQRNAWFDAMIARELGRVGDVSSLKAQNARLAVIAGQIQARLKITKDITRRLNLQDQLLDLFRTQRENRAAIGDAAKQQAADAAAASKALKDAARQRAKDAADALRAARQASAESTRGWIDFAIERADATGKVKKEIQARRTLITWLQAMNRLEGVTLDRVRDIWKTRQEIRNLNKKNAGVDPLAGLMQVSSKRLANILAAGTGLDLAGRRILGANIAAAEIQPVHVHVNLDGREVAAVVTKQQTRAGMRTARQTSGFRG